MKNEEYYGDVSLYNTSCTIVSMYAINIQVRDKNIMFIAISNGDIELMQFGEYPCDNYDDLFAFYRQNNKERLEATKEPRKMAKLSFLSSILLFILLLVLGIILKLLALIIISIVILLFGFIIGIKFVNDVKKLSKPFREKAKEKSINDYKKKEIYKEESYQAYIRKNNIDII